MEQKIETTRRFELTTWGVVLLRVQVYWEIEIRRDDKKSELAGLLF